MYHKLENFLNKDLDSAANAQYFCGIISSAKSDDAVPMEA
jgi:hypothetical protein